MGMLQIVSNRESCSNITESYNNNNIAFTMPVCKSTADSYEASTVNNIHLVSTCFATTATYNNGISKNANNECHS